MLSLLDMLRGLDLVIDGLCDSETCIIAFGFLSSLISGSSVLYLPAFSFPAWRQA